MSIASVRRRLGNIERSGVFAPKSDRPPFDMAEVKLIAGQILKEEPFTREELRRLEKHSPVIGREEIITAYGGIVLMKRYPGVDLSLI